MSRGAFDPAELILVRELVTFKNDRSTTYRVTRTAGDSIIMYDTATGKDKQAERYDLILIPAGYKLPRT